MDITQVAQSSYDLLISQLPQFKQLGWKIPEGIASAIGASVFQRASDLWNRLRGRAGSDPDLQSTLNAVQQEEPDAADRLRAQLTELLQNDPAFAAELTPLIQTVSGSGNITAGGDVNIDNLSQTFGAPKD